MDNGKIGKRFRGKVAIVTASTQGIGFQIARRLAFEGASVVISSRRQRLFILGKQQKMAKKVKERFEAVEQEITNIKMELLRLLELEAKIMKQMEKVDLQNEKNQQQQQLILKYIKGMGRNNHRPENRKDQLAK
ncbi:tropinone reductase-like 3 [Cucumis melo var. makuwa]|uniref:Tropinone reductase-like 3 n=1 Tax=Cucumis melo var. makuwa TaxID=1194695 RepID=A0A5A7UGA6_CUCMM|nr:tropinone reductase-like 3 [Cucumis melo var. makuwa]TYK12337.1 tropinone reductase-like 3 [Cucumis melo var. makuwa]